MESMGGNNLRDGEKEKWGTYIVTKRCWNQSKKKKKYNAAWVGFRLSKYPMVLLELFIALPSST
jgi:hypothetical protein